MPSLAALKSVRPPLAVPSEIATIESETETARCFSALVRMQAAEAGYDSCWSTSTPMALMFAAQAASMMPLPVRPATWNRTSMPVFWVMNWSPNVLPAA